MTQIKYICKGNDGVEDVVLTLPEAQNFVKEHGGTYEIKYNTYLSEYEGHARKGHRAGGKQQGIRI